MTLEKLLAHFILPSHPLEWYYKFNVFLVSGEVSASLTEKVSKKTFHTQYSYIANVESRLKLNDIRAASVF